MASPTIKDVSLMGPNQAYAPDIQAKMAKEALAQQIAEALIGNSLNENNSSPIHTGGANPFARDVVNFGGLGQLGEAYFGNKKLGESQDAQFKLASQGIARRQSEMAGVFAPVAGETTASREQGPPTAAGEPSFSVQPGQDRPPNYTEMITRALMGTDPATQGVGQGMLKNLQEADLKRVVDPMSTGRILGQVTPESFQAAQKPGPMGAPVLDNNVPLKQKPVVSTISPGQTIGITNPNADPGVSPGPSQTVKTLPTPSTALVEPGGTFSDGSKNTSGFRMRQTPAGEKELIPGDPAVVAASDQAKEKGGDLHSGQAQVQAFNNFMPTVASIGKLLINARTGNQTADWLNEAQKVYIALGGNPDDKGKISDKETMMKFLTPLATTTLKGISARPSQLEYVQQMMTAGASAVTDKRAVANILQKFVADGLNFSDTHQENMANYEKIAGLGKGAAAPFGAVSDPDKTMAQLNDLQFPISIGQNAAKKWSLEGAGGEASHQAIGEGKLGNQTKTVNGVTYTKIDGVWHQ